ncbi:sensor histidine kinase [Shewanella sp. HL-SH2]|uniref:sensor histidine kinase n=1 Tax=Shewanella sp. HL-SH2 TaxID=3436238 RepID=UPI003EBB8978
MNKLINIIIISLFSIFMVLYSALLQAKPGEAIQWHFDAPVWMAIQCLIAQWLTLRWFSFYQNSKHILSNTQCYIRVFLLSNVSFTFAVTGLIVALEFAIGIQAINVVHIISLLSMQFILHTIVGGFTLAFKVFEDIKQQHSALEQSEKALLQSQVKTLQQHIDPHFLFNNLNVLSALIQQDPDEADEYLNTFSDIYRYILQHKDHSLVPLEHELIFAKNYMSLISTRFEGAYVLEIIQKPGDNLRSHILPCALQLAIENVIKHNQGNKLAPTKIEITIDADKVSIGNQISQKSFKPESTQLGLQNLRTRCVAICNQPLEVEHTEHYFRLTLPLSVHREFA